ncbi:MAG: M28 family metallopeptidase [Hyphomonadaceae bacterium]|nr:M28 family metallopeptidase [Hyphomonadaceae bacterium]
MRAAWIAAGAAALALGGCGMVRGLLPGDPETGRPAPVAAVQAPARIAAFQHAPLSAGAIMAHVDVLASDAFDGRLPGTRGEALTLDYIERAFAAIGLQPGVVAANGAVGWRQSVPLVTARVSNSPAMRVTGADGARDYAFGTQHVVWTKRMEPATNIADAEMVFVGYGVVAPERNWNDYAGIDMRGRIAVILINDPDFETGDDRGFGGRAMTYYGRWTYKSEEAARQGAAGAIIIHETAPAAYPWAVVQNSNSGPKLDIVRPDRGASRVGVEGWISTPTAAELFQRANLNFADLKARAQRPGFTPTPMGLRMSLSLQTELTEQASYNVVGVLPGRSRAGETILYTAHWDHLGRCPPANGDDICNGALDNATGTAGLIELARRFAGEGRHERSIAFVAFTAEEQGLLGSEYYAENPVFPAARTVGAVNMDGLNIYGPARNITVVGYGKSTMEDLLRTAAQTQGRTIEGEAFPERGSFYRSDHFNLARIGIPVLYASGGLDLVDGGVERGSALQSAYIAERYHKPDDEVTPDWNIAGGVQDLQLFYQVGETLANGTDWPVWRPGAEFAAAREQSMRGAAR